LTLILAAAALFGSWLNPSTASAQATAYVIADHTSGTILESSNGEKKLQIASLTKIVTGMVVLDWANSTGAELNQLATVPTSAQALGSAPGVGLQPGDRCSLRDLLYAALMQSDNQAAETLAAHVGSALGTSQKIGPTAAFVAQMNALARRLGMLKSRFLNAHGLDTLEKALPYSTAEDLAKLTSYAMANSAFRFYVSQTERRITIQVSTGGETQYLLRNTNELIGRNAIDGVKTGTTRKAGQCLILSAARTPESRQEGERHIITPRRLNVIILGAPGDRFATGTQLMSRGWQLHEEWAAQGRPALNTKKR
jgi:D-alanyl-D-alanine carboxypeptidase (penicillin-binding protein 5/6)